ncbi:hypothetical protein PR202_gb13286 [Eleusine coracana subsp. coracana]|uniref:Uncharacterized protein n=1 Tax=Eleusine coracana subsp. coracana TaxID=191504 RepID=A0AAV5ERQ8_ELECO|nr:hypothetical protein PR202_gb13286 [Eleusine coracana subsp. coracana]
MSATLGLGTAALEVAHAPKRASRQEEARGGQRWRRRRPRRRRGRAVPPQLALPQGRARRPGRRRRPRTRRLLTPAQGEEEGRDAQGRRRGAAGDRADQGGGPRQLLQEDHQRLKCPSYSSSLSWPHGVFL